MPIFIWKAKDRYGQEVAQRINAESAQRAKEILLNEGYTDLRLQQDEIMDISRQQVVEASDPDYDLHLTAQQEVEQFEGKVPTFWSNWLNAIRKSWFKNCLWTAFLVWGFYSDSLWMQIVAAIFLFLSVFLFPALSFWFGMPLRLYNQLLYAKVWYRWPEVYALSYRLEKVQNLVKISAGPVETTRLRAQALAGMGKLPEAIKEFEPFSDPAKLEPALYYSHLSGIYDVARDFDTALTLKLKAAEAMPQNSSFFIDVAFHYLLRNKDLVKGREALAKVDESLVVELGKSYLELLRGLILLLEGNPVPAQEKFETALKGFQPYLHTVIIESIINLTKSHLCLAYALAGDRDKAIALWQEMEPYLEAVKEKELADKIRAALGVHA